MNVGCIPKKLMHYAALLGEARADQVGAGWKVDTEAKHNWEQMQTTVAKHIKVINHPLNLQLIALNRD